MQRQFWVLLGCWALLGSCSPSDRTPDVSHIKTKVTLARFDQAFFALDTAQLATGLDSLANNFSAFYPEYMQFILGVSGDPADSNTQRTVRQFIGAYRSVQDSLQPRFADIRSIEKELQTSFSYLQYYFPSYKTGTITFLQDPSMHPASLPCAVEPQWAFNNLQEAISLRTRAPICKRCIQAT